VSIAEKLQLKPGQRVRLVNSPQVFSLDAEMAGGEAPDAVVVFARSKAELETHAGAAIEAARRDEPSWIAYPKGGELDSDLNRGVLWKLLEDKGIKPGRQVALDDIWSAIRFGPA
jgi:hypothetical protein